MIDAMNVSPNAKNRCVWVIEIRSRNKYGKWLKWKVHKLTKCGNKMTKEEAESLAEYFMALNFHNQYRAVRYRP